MTSLLMMANKNMNLLVGDNVVTLRDNKTVKGVHKVFKLSSAPSMGMMLFGAADFCNSSVPVLINKFAKETDFNQLKSVENVKNAFLDFVGKNTENLSLDEYIKFHEKEFRQDMKFQLEGLSSEEFEVFMGVQRRHEVFSFIEKYNLKFDDLICDLVEDNKIGYYNDMLMEMFSQKLLPNSTGIVIAGFDKGNESSSFVNFFMFANDNGDVIHETSVSQINCCDSTIMSFAVDEEINQYIDGIGEDIEFFIRIYLKDMLEKHFDVLYYYFKSKNIYSQEVLEEIKKNLIEFRNMDDYFINEFMEKIEFVKKENRDIILNVVDTFPVDELIEFAEFFIKITSSRFRFSFDPLYVGDEVDIALLTQDDFKWIKYGGNFV